jgi:hypothetical protein
VSRAPGVNPSAFTRRRSGPRRFTDERRRGWDALGLVRARRKPAGHDSRSRITPWPSSRSNRDNERIPHRSCTTLPQVPAGARLFPASQRGESPALAGIPLIPAQPPRATTGLSRRRSRIHSSLRTGLDRRVRHDGDHGAFGCVRSSSEMGTSTFRLRLWGAKTKVGRSEVPIWRRNRINAPRRPSLGVLDRGRCSSSSPRGLRRGPTGSRF